MGLSETIHTFEVDDMRARIQYGGWDLRAVQVRWDADSGLSVDFVRVTRKGTDYKRPNSWTWLTITTIEQLAGRGEGELFGKYVRKIHAEKVGNAAPRAGVSTVADAARRYGVNVPTTARALLRTAAQVYTPLGDACGVIEQVTGPGVVILRLVHNNGQWHGNAAGLVLSSDAVHVLDGHLG